MSEKNKVVDLGAYRNAAGSATPPIEPPDAVGRLVSYAALQGGNTAMHVILPPKKGWWRRKKSRVMTVMGHSTVWTYARSKREKVGDNWRIRYYPDSRVSDPEVIECLSTLWVDRETLAETKELLNER